MSRVDVASLRLRTSASQARRAQARTEEALRLAAPEDERLVVLRRLDLGRLPGTASQAQWARRAEFQMSAQVARAVPASSGAAAAAEAVWFASASEARLLLLAELAAGRRPSAWYWRLAVPDWQGAPAGPYLSTLLAQARRSPQSLVELARAITAMAELPLLRTLLAGISEPGSSMPGAATATPPVRATSAQSQTPAIAPSPAREQAARRLARMPLRLRHVLAEAVADRALAPAAARVLVRLALVADAPELAAQITHLEACVEAVIDALRAEAVAPPARHATPTVPTAPDPQARNAGVQAPAGRRTGAPDADAPTAASGAATDDDRPSAPMFIEQGSAAAGLWLLVRPLARMGLGDWLEERPGLCAAGFGPVLLRHIAERMRIEPADPAFAFLEPPLATIDPALLAAWRIGLDRWLRRRVRRKLAEVVRRRGWLSAHPSGVSVRFRLAQADLALRLQALDADPGWVPWLGRQVKYHYRDEAAR